MIKEKEMLNNITDVIDKLDKEIDKTKIKHYDNLMLREKIKQEQDKEKELERKKSRHILTTITGIITFMVLISVAFANTIMFSHVMFLTPNNQTSVLYLYGNIFLAICLVIFYTGFMVEQNEKDKKGTYD